MRHHNTYLRHGRFSGVAALAMLLAACGGSGDGAAPGTGNAPPAGSATSSISGTAATGNPIVGGTVTLSCANAGTATATTSSTGDWTASVPSSNLPCALEVTGGTVGGIANTDAFFSTTPGTGSTLIANLSPLTSLALAGMTGSTPNHAWFAGLNDVNRLALANGTAAAISALQSALSAQNFTLPAGSFNPFSTPFTATAGNGYDDLLEQIRASFTVSVPNFQALVSAYATGASLPPAPAGAASVSASGSLTLGNGDSFTPQADGLEVSLKASTNDPVTYTFYRHTERQIPYGASYLTTTDKEEVTVVKKANGNHTVIYLKQVYGSSTVQLICQNNCGVSISTASGSTHPVTVSFNASTLTTYPASATTLTLTGTLAGDASGTLWDLLELPRTTTGAIGIDGNNLTVITASKSSTVAGGLTLSATLSDGSSVVISQNPGQATSVLRSQTAPSGVLMQQCASACGVTIADSASATTVTFSSTVLTTSINTSSLPGTAVTLSNHFTIGASTGTLTNSSGSIASFTPVADSVESSNQTRVYVFNNLGVSGGGTLLSVTALQGVVTNVSLALNNGASLYSCMNNGSAIGLPACAGISIGADGRTLMFANVALKGGSPAATLTFNGTLVGKGL